MPELAPRATTAAVLSAETGRLAAALAELLDGLAEEHADVLADSAAFLRRMADAGDRAAAGDAFPLDRLCAGLDLSAIERDLVVLAGMPEEHEGYAGVLRCVCVRAHAERAN